MRAATAVVSSGSAGATGAGVSVRDLRIADEDGEESAAEASLPGAGKIEVPLVGALEKGATGERQIEQRIVVTVEDRDSGGDGHGSRRSVAIVDTGRGTS